MTLPMPKPAAIEMSHARLLFQFFVVPVLLSPASLHATTVQPAELHFETRLDEAPLLTLDVDLQTTRPANFTVEMEGFKCDRRIIPKGNGRFLVEIAPDTSLSGSVNGDILLKNSGKLVEPSIPISGIVRPWVSAQPSRLFVGSIGHGTEFEKPRTYSLTLSSDNEPFDVRSVEFQGIKGASWTCDPAGGLLAQQKRVNLTFTSNALAVGVPYGALVQKFILVHLNHPKTSEIVIPTTGLISVNTTGRDYSLYLYDSHVRWRGPWETPNIAAAFLATAMILLCAVGCMVHNLLAGQPRWRIVFAGIVFSALAASCHFLVQTYSRGGWIAAAAGVSVLLLTIRSPRFYAMGLAILFALEIVLHPAGLSRVASTSEVSQDKSISHRLLVWQGALQMMAEHPWKGVDPSQFGTVFTRDYRLPTHTDEYTTAVNDFLTFGAERGIPLLALVTSILFGLVIIALRIGVQERNVLLAGCGAAMLCYLACCCFSSIGFCWNPSFLLVAPAVAILVGTGWREIRTKKGNLLFRTARCSILWLLLSAGIFIGFWLLGAAALTARPVTSRIEIAGVSGLEVQPRWITPRGSIIYIGDSAESPDALLQSTLRPLARKGWTVLCFDHPPFASEAYDQTLAIIKEMQALDLLKSPWFIAGHRRGAQLALGLASVCNSRAIACYLMPAKSAFPDLSPIAIMPRLNVPVLLGAQDADSGRSQQRLSEIANISRNSKVNVETALHHGQFSEESPRWELWIDCISSFCSGLL